MFSIHKMLIKLYRQSLVRKRIGSGVKWAECSLIIGTGCRVQVFFFAWSSIAQSVCQWAFSLLAIRCLRPWVRILHSAEEDNLSPFDSNIACLCQSIDINNKHKTLIKLTSPFRGCLSSVKKQPAIEKETNMLPTSAYRISCLTDVMWYGYCVIWCMCDSYILQSQMMVVAAVPIGSLNIDNRHAET